MRSPSCSEAILIARQRHVLGSSILGIGLRLRHGGARRRRRLCLRRGNLAAGSLEGKRGMCAPSRRCPRSKACSASRPLSTTCLARRRCRSFSTRAAAFYKDFGMGRSRGTMPFQLAGNIKHGGLFETRFRHDPGRAHRRFRRRHRDRPPSRRCRSAGRWGLISRASCSTRRSTMRLSPPRTALIGHGGIVVFDDTADMAEAGALRHGILRHRMLRQVHALPHRLDPRRRDDGPDRARASSREKQIELSPTFARR